MGWFGAGRGGVENGNSIIGRGYSNFRRWVELRGNVCETYSYTYTQTRNYVIPLRPYKCSSLCCYFTRDLFAKLQGRYAHHRTSNARKKHILYYVPLQQRHNNHRILWLMLTLPLSRHSNGRSGRKLVCRVQDVSTTPVSGHVVNQMCASTPRV